MMNAMAVITSSLMGSTMIVILRMMMRLLADVDGDEDEKLT